MQMVLFFLEPCERFRSCCFCVYSKCVAICGQISLVIFVLVVLILGDGCWAWLCGMYVYIWFNFDVTFPYPYVLVSALLMLCLRALQVYTVGMVWCWWWWVTWGFRVYKSCWEMCVCVTGSESFRCLCNVSKSKKEI